VILRLLRDIVGEVLVRAGERIRGPIPESFPPDDGGLIAEVMLGDAGAANLTDRGEALRAAASTPRRRAPPEKPVVLEGSLEARSAAARLRAAR
jgi:hypothetical protein